MYIKQLELLHFLGFTFQNCNLKSFKLKGVKLYYFNSGSCVGRLFKYSEKTNKLEIVKDKLCFANGVQLDYYENLVVVAEMMAKRVLFIDTKTFRVVRSLKVNGG